MNHFKRYHFATGYFVHAGNLAEITIAGRGRGYEGRLPGRRRYLLSEENFIKIGPSPSTEWYVAYCRERCTENLLRI